MNIKKTIAGLFSIITLFSCSNDKYPDLWNLSDDDEKNEVVIPMAEKRRVVWIDAAANFKYFANSKENIALYLTKAKDAGFTEIVVDVRPTSGDVLFKSAIVDEVKKIGDVTRTETWDYLACFIEESKKLGLKVNASINTFVGGNIDNGGVVYREPKKAEWLSMMNYPNPLGMSSIFNNPGAHAKFFNPVLPDAQNYVLSIIAELATKYTQLDGIVLDRARFNSIESDFSAYTKEAFEKYSGQKIAKYPDDIFSYNGDKIVEGAYYKKWLEFRAKTIYDFFAKAKDVVKSKNANMNFSTYTGSWYSMYYQEGVNWASSKYDPSKKYSWATPEYKNFGYAGLLDFYMTGAYGKTLTGPGEWTVEGGILNAKAVTMGDVPVLGGLYGLNFSGKPQDAEEATFIAMTKGDGLMFFDIIYLIMYDQWKDVKKGIDRALATEKK